MSLSFHKTRIAPTPSGYLHLGNILSFVLTAGMARKFGAGILLRIDDMDRDRMRPAYLEDIFETLEYLEIPWDEGPRSASEHLQTYTQLNRRIYYAEALEQLKKKELLFACSCSRSAVDLIGNTPVYPGTCLQKDIPLNEPNMQWRFRTDKCGPIEIRDLQSGQQTMTLPSVMQYFQVRKKNGDPAYQLSSLIDDLHFGIDLIIRGQDLWESSLAQLSLAKKLEAQSFLSAGFIHHPLLKGEDQAKLSKSAGSTSIHHLRKTGMKKERIFQQLALAIGSDEQPNNWMELFMILEKKWVPMP